MDETRLGRAFAAREQWAFNDAYGRYGGLLYAAAYGVLHAREDAEDCVHDALLRVWKNPASYSTERGALRSFLAVCVRNEAISRLRKKRNAERVETRALRETPLSEEFDVPDYVERDRLRKAIAALPAEQREPLVLAYYGGKTHVQIADELQTPLGTIKSRLAQAVRKLGTLLMEPEPAR